MDYAGVIVGKDLEVIVDGEGNEVLKANPDFYFDKAGKPILDKDKENIRLTEYIKKIYYILLTRGIYGTAYILRIVR